MNISSLEYLIALSKTLNVTRAADSMNITQPAFSRMLSKAEEEIGIKIFVRTNKGVSVTPEGAIFLRSLENSLDIFKSGIKLAKASRKQDRAVLKIGYVPDAVNKDIVETVALLHSSRDDLDIQLVEVYYFEMSSALKSKKVDAIVYTSFLPTYSDDVDYFKLGETELVAITSKFNHLVNEQRLKPYDIHNLCVIDIQHDNYLSQSWSFCQKFYKYFNVYPDTQIQVSSRASLITQISCQRNAITLMPAVLHDCFYDFRDMHVKSLSIENCPTCERHIIWSRGHKHSLLDEFISVLRTVEYKRP